MLLQTAIAIVVLNPDAHRGTYRPQVVRDYATLFGIIATDARPVHCADQPLSVARHSERSNAANRAAAASRSALSAMGA